MHASALWLSHEAQRLRHCPNVHIRRCLVIEVASETPAAPGPRGLHTTTNSKRAFLTAPALPNTTQFHEKTQTETEERMKFPAGERKKARNFAPAFLGLGPWPTLKQNQTIKNHKKKTSTKNSKQSISNISNLNFGQNRFWPDGFGQNPFGLSQCAQNRLQVQGRGRGQGLGSGDR